MNTFGFIGFGSMAKMLIHNLIENVNINPNHIYVTRKDKDRLFEINHVFKDVIVVNTIHDVMTKSNIVFICVKPIETKNVLTEMTTLITDDKHIISLAGSVSLNNIESIINGKITKYMPTITSEVGTGVSLICHNNHVNENDAVLFENIIKQFSKIKHVDDEDWGFAAELTSCMPGFISSIFNNLINEALKHTLSFNKETVNKLITDTLHATAELYLKTGMNFEQVVSRVATKGGITQEGVKVLDEALPQVFDDLFKVTLAKRHLVVEKINSDFENR